MQNIQYNLLYHKGFLQFFGSNSYTSQNHVVSESWEGQLCFYRLAKMTTARQLLGICDCLSSIPERIISRLFGKTGM